MGNYWSSETETDSKFSSAQLASANLSTQTERINAIFEKLDKDKDGQIDMNEFVEALHKHGVKGSTATYAEKFFDEVDLDRNGYISLQEFTTYMESHERTLKNIYTSIHRHSGENFNVQGLIAASNKYGISLSEAEAQELVDEMEIYHEITWEIFRDFFILSTNSNIRDTIDFWKNHTIYSDLSETGAIPKDTFLVHPHGENWWKFVIAGGLSGCISRTFTAPLDRLKVFMQTHEMHTPNNKSHGLRHHFKAFIEDGGVRSFWRGNGVSVLKATPEYAIKCFAYEKLKDLIRGPGTNRDLKVFERFLAGSMAGGFCETIIYPLELLKTRFLLRKSTHGGSFFGLVRDIFRKDGAKGFYKGYPLSVAGIVPFAGLDLMMYETLKRHYMKNYHRPDEIERKSKLPYVALVVCGATSTSIGLLFTYPIVLLKTRMQAAGAFNNINNIQQQDNTSSNLKKTKLLHTIKEIWKNSGPTGFYRGVVPCLLKVLPSVSISYLVYEKSLETLGAKML